MVLKILFFIYLFSIGLSILQFEFVGVILFSLIFLSVFAWLAWTEWVDVGPSSKNITKFLEMLFPFFLMGSLYVLVWLKLEMFWVMFILEFQSFMMLGACYLFKSSDDWTMMSGVEGSMNYMFPAFFSFMLMLVYIILSTYSMCSSYQVDLMMNVMLTLSVLTKLGAFPMFMWVPKVFKNVCYNTLMLLSVMSKVFLIAMMLLYLPIKGPGLLLMGSVTIIMSSFYMMGTSNMKSFLAFSSIANVGWTLVLFICTNSELPLSLTGPEVLCLFFFFYAFNFILFCLMVDKGSHSHLYYLPNKLMTNQHFVIFLSTLVLTLLSLSGFPPFSGFFGKYIILLEYYNYSLLITFFLLLISALFVFIYLSPVVYYLFMGSSNIIKGFYKSNDSKSMYNNLVSYLFLINIHIIFCILHIL